jgi:hypothetical protein
VSFVTVRPDHRPAQRGPDGCAELSMQCGPLVAAFIVGARFGGTAGTFVPCSSARLVSAPPNATFLGIKGIGCGTMSDETPVCQIQKDENGDIFVFVGGMKIAKRGLPDTPHADTWIMLEPGWLVRDVKDGRAIEVSYEHTRMH